MVKHSSRIELSQSALKKNINFIRKKIGEKAVISSVVKANAYGHGIDPFVKMAEKAGINHFAVASAFEAEKVLAIKSASSSVMIMGILYEQDFDWAVSNEIEIYVFNYERLEQLKKIAVKLNKQVKVHLEVETGANRTGIPFTDFNKSLTYLKRNKKHLEFTGLCTHFGGAETYGNKFKIDKQHKIFKELCGICKKRKFLPKYRHIASSAASLMYSDTVYDLVRVGVTQYGFWPSPDVYYHHLQEVGKLADNPLRRIISWKTDIMDIRDVEEGEFIGYGTAYQATQSMTIAVLPLGYSNGYPRAQSNRGYVLIKGKKARITGLINMNLFMVEISHIPDAKVGDEVILVGRQKNKSINISSFTQVTHLLNNEMLSRLPSDIPRKPVR